MSVQSNHEALFKERGPIELKLAVEALPKTDKDTGIVSLMSRKSGVISRSATA